MTDFISLRNISKCYSAAGRSVFALKDLSLDIRENEFLAVVGRSGSGKTTLLRILASLEEPTAGEMRFRGKLCSPENPLPSGMVFQDARLMPWLSALENIIFAFPPRERTAELHEAAKKMLETVGLSGCERSMPRELSGGMAQRVALGRALIKNPSVILLDEPLGALDYFTRRAMQRELIRIYLQEKKSFIMVTHDVGEALRMGTRVIVLGEGQMRKEINVDFSYPRPRSDPRFQRLIDEVLDAIGDGE